jgi:hypothetical protein
MMRIFSMLIILSLSALCNSGESAVITHGPKIATALLTGLLQGKIDVACIEKIDHQNIYHVEDAQGCLKEINAQILQLENHAKGRFAEYLSVLKRKRQALI